jgi:hypothetical protein
MTTTVAKPAIYIKGINERFGSDGMNFRHVVFSGFSMGIL